MRRQKATGNSRKRCKRRCRRWRNLQTLGSKEACHYTPSHGICVSVPASLEKLPCCEAWRPPSPLLHIPLPPLQLQRKIVTGGSSTRPSSSIRLAIMPSPRMKLNARGGTVSCSYCVHTVRCSRSMASSLPYLSIHSPPSARKKCVLRRQSYASGLTRQSGNWELIF